MIRLEHDRVTGDESRQAVGDRHGQWIVPRPDDTDDTLWYVMPIDSGQQRYEAFATLRAQVATCRASVIARGECNVQYLLGGTQPRLPGRLQQVDEVVPLVQNMIMKIEQQLGPLLDWPSGPVA